MLMRCFSGFTLLLASFVSVQLSLVASEPLAVSPPTSGAKAVEEFKTREGFSLTLLAEEPLVTDPVAMCYDADGRAYVAEMNDYPYTDKATHQPMQENPGDKAIGKIRLLTDDDGDGIFDRSSIFADGLSWPTGVVPWKGGVFVVAVPDLWYFKDTTGDCVADVKKRITTGFRKYNVQAGANTPIWGLDNRIYIATGRNKGSLSDQSDAVTEIPGGRDVRIDPRNPENFDLVSGGIQFGNAIDDHGNRFLCSAGGSVHHVVLPSDALARNPWLPSRATVRSCLDKEDPVKLYPITEIEGWRIQRYKDRKFVPRPGFTESRGEKSGDPARPTSSCGPAVYRGDAYPANFRGSVFVAESCYNLVYQLESKREGASFKMAKPAKNRKSDFIASKDVWFRPMAMINAPDGCLHLLDFYRESIEHPWSLPEAFHERMDLLLGRDRGRIYRIEPSSYQHRAPMKLSTMKSRDLVSLLEHPNAWHRETAQRLLFERQDLSVVEELNTLAVGSENSLGRLHATWTLHGLDALDPSILQKLSSDPDAGFRENVARISTLMISKHSELVSVLLELAKNTEPSVRFEAALALGAVTIPENSAAISAALTSIAKRDSKDQWARLAILSSSRPYATGILSELLNDPSFQDVSFLGSLAKIVGAENQASEPATLFSNLVVLPGDPDQITFAVVLGLADGLRIAKSTLQKLALDVEGGGAFLSKMIECARALALNPEAHLSRRTEAIQFLRNASFELVSGDLERLLQPGTSGELQSDAASVLSILGSRHSDAGGMLLAGWEGYSGEVRNEVLQLLLAREERLDALLNAVQEGKIQPYQLGASRREELIAHKNPEVAKKAKTLFAGTGSRVEVVKKFQSVLTMKGDAAKGESIYQGVCMACHKFREQGLIDLAPNLAVVSTWEAERILTNILDPNRDVAPEYMEYLVETKDGSTIGGRVVSESPTGITMRLADNSMRDISRAEIKTLNNSGRSLMPDGLEAAISEQAMADLIAFLQTRQ